jgi:hypothetical protein
MRRGFWEKQMFTQADVDYVNKLIVAANLPADATLADEGILLGGIYYIDKQDGAINVSKEYVIPGGYWEPDCFDVSEIHTGAKNLVEAVQIIACDWYRECIRDAALSIAESERWTELDKAMAGDDLPF